MDPSCRTHQIACGEEKTMSEYGKLGWDVGRVGRWIRLVLGLLLVAFVIFDFSGADHTHSLRTNLLTVLFFVAFVAAYSVVYLVVVDRVKDMSPWIATAIFVFPAIYFSAVNAFMVPPEASFGHLIGLPYVNHPLFLAMVLYIGISFPVQFFTRYGGCEVVAIQNLVFRKECSSYCVPLLPVDLVEKAVVDAFAKRR